MILRCDTVRAENGEEITSRAPIPRKAAKSEFAMIAALIQDVDACGQISQAPPPHRAEARSSQPTCASRSSLAIRCRNRAAHVADDAPPDTIRCRPDRSSTIIRLVQDYIHSRSTDQRGSLVCLSLGRRRCGRWAGKGSRSVTSLGVPAMRGDLVGQAQ